MSVEKSYPTEANLGKDCSFWRGVETAPKAGVRPLNVGCFFPKAEMEGRLSCEGIIDDVCLYLKDKRPPTSLTSDQISEIKHRIPSGDNRDLPPGDTL